MRKIFLLSGLLALLSVSAWGQTAVRSLNDGWLFRRGDAAAGRWEQVSLPHTWNADAYKLKNYYRGKGTYQRVLPPESNLHDGRRIFLKIDAACQSAKVYVNDQLAATHRGGYSAFTTDITSLLSPTADNRLRIEVTNADPDAAPVSADFTFMGGIYRDVWLITTPGLHLDQTDFGTDGVQVSTANVSERSAEVSVQCRVRNDEVRAAAVQLQHLLYAPDGRQLAVLNRRLRLAAGGTTVFEARFPVVTAPQLWAPEHPVLYKVVTVLRDKSGHELQRTEHPVGFRWCRFDADRGFFLNGKPYKLRGMCIHQDQQPYGVAMDDDMHRRDVRLMKDLGANFVRLAHYQQDDATLEACDRLGLLVWEEIPCVNSVPESEAFADACEQNLREMIRQHRNHPSVILWGYMNEILLQTNNLYQGEARQIAVERILTLARRLERVLKEEDPDRHSTMALHGTDDYNRLGISNVTDVIGWNLYQGWYGGDMTGFDRYLAAQHSQQPTHPVIVSEWGAGSDRRLHTQKGQPFDFSMEYQQQYIEHYLPVIEQTPYIFGGSYWNFIDFSSAGRDESMPRINNKGIVFADRTPKDVFYYFKAHWRTDVPVLHIATRDWPQRSATTAAMPIKVYTNLTEVELSVNGRSLGKQSVQNCFAVFEVPLAEGKNLLMARGVLDGQNVEDAATVVFQPVAPLDSDQLELTVNVGSHCSYTSSKSQVTWLPDQPYQAGGWGYVGGEPASTQGEILATDEGPLYQTWQEGIDSYCFDVPAGRYEVELYHVGDAADSQSSIYLLGSTAATGSRYAVCRRFSADHPGGTLTVRIPFENGPKRLSAIHLRRK